MSNNQHQHMEIENECVNLAQETFEQYQNRNIQKNVNELLENFNEYTYINYCNVKKNGFSDIQFDQYYHSNINNFFEVWRGTVAFLVYRQIQMLLADIPDFPYYDCFVERTAPQQMAQNILDNLP
jgi:hypothetical protein